MRSHCPQVFKQLDRLALLSYFYSLNQPWGKNTPLWTRKSIFSKINISAVVLGVSCKNKQSTASKYLWRKFEIIIFMKQAEQEQELKTFKRGVAAQRKFGRNVKVCLRKALQLLLLSFCLLTFIVWHLKSAEYFQRSRLVLGLNYKSIKIMDYNRK